MKKRKELITKALAGVMSATMVMSLLPSAALAAVTPEDVAKVADGTYVEKVTVNPDADNDFAPYDMEISVTVSNGKITAVDFAHEDASDIEDDDNWTYSDQAMNGFRGKVGMASKIVEANSTDVEAVSGATCSSNAIIKAVETALENAVSDEEEETVDTKELLDLIEEVKALSDADYTAESWKTFQDKLSKANDVLANENATQKDVDAAKADLQSAYGALEKAAEPEEPDVGDEDDAVYALLNIPYDEFYALTGVAVSDYDYDTVSAATNKVGNYAKAGGGYHTKATAEVAEDGTVTAVGGANGASVKGVIWPVKVSSEDALASLGGEEITDESSKTIATLGKGSTTSSTVVGYEALTEADTYSYYILKEAPDYYMNLSVTDGKPEFSIGSDDAVEGNELAVDVEYGTNWGDVDLDIEDNAASDKIVNAVVFTAEDSEGNESQVGMVHLYNIWAYYDIAWYAEDIPGLDGKTITNIRYYCSVKDTKMEDGVAPAYENYVYDYPVNFSVPSVYEGKVTAEFTDDNTITLSGLPKDAENVTAKVYHTTGGRGATYTYLTPLTVDPADDDIDPVTVDVVDGIITIEPGSVTNSKSETQSYGNPVDGTTYTIELSSENYIISKTSVDYNPIYALVNIPYDEFYALTGVTVSDYDYDTVSAATNKVGNYGKAGGGYHTEATAGTDEKGETIAVGGANGASVEGVIWPVKVSSKEALASLGGDKITDEEQKTIATFARGTVTASIIDGYEVLMEAATYSYYILDKAPAYYMNLTVTDGNPVFSIGSDDAEQAEDSLDVDVEYGTNWGDVDLDIEENAASDKTVNAVVFTAVDSEGKESQVGMVHLYNIWTYNNIAWYAKDIPGLDGKTITNIRYYCSVKDTDTTDGIAPSYTNYVYDYPVNFSVPPVYEGEVTAEFTNDNTITLTGLPEDAENVTAKVYYTTGGRHATYTYLTPLTVDPADDDIDPVSVQVVDGVITIKAGSVTNNAGTTQTYGMPVNGTTYTVELSSENYIISSTAVTYTVNTADLEALINTAEKLAESAYTSDSWSALQTALTSAKAALEAKASQSAVDQAAADLQAAIDALAKKPSDSGSSNNGSDGNTNNGSSVNNGTSNTGNNAATGNGTTAKLPGKAINSATKTSDAGNVFGWLGLAIASAAAGGFTWRKKRK